LRDEQPRREAYTGGDHEGDLGVLLSLTWTDAGVVVHDVVGTPRRIEKVDKLSAPMEVG
jgi:hypothetical protein